jgi:hypothetical protein
MEEDIPEYIYFYSAYPVIHSVVLEYTDVKHLGTQYYTSGRRPDLFLAMSWIYSCIEVVNILESVLEHNTAVFHYIPAWGTDATSILNIEYVRQLCTERLVS